MRDGLAKHIAYYFPLLMPSLLVVLPWAIAYLKATTDSLNHAADLTFAVMTFWIWAITTNGHSRMLVASGGRKEGDEEQRANEFLMIVALSVVTAIAWMVTHLTEHPVTYVSPVVAIGTAVLTLGAPD